MHKGCIKHHVIIFGALKCLIVYFLFVLYCVDVLQASVVETTLLRCDFGRTSQLFAIFETLNN